MKSSKLIRTPLFFILLLIAVLFLVPIFYSVFTSFKHQTEILKDGTFFVHNPTLSNYVYVFQRGSKYLTYYWNSVVITGVGLLITVLLSAMAGYSFAKLPFKGSGIFLAFILFVVTFPLAALLIPIYIMEFNAGILNTKIGLILPNVMNVLPFSVFIMRGVFIGIPKELEDSAEIDGCTIFRTWKDIMLPIAQNGLIIVLVFSFYSIWGEYTMAKTLATQDFSMPISVALTLLKGEDWNFGVLGAVISMAIVPPVVIFLIFQNKLVSGLVAGAVKG